MLKLKNINSFYGEVQVLFDLSLEVEPGEMVTLLGSNGAGKTTTVKAIFNINPIRSGEIWFDNQRIDRLPSHKLPAMGIGLIPEGRHLFPAMSVQDNLLMGAYTCDDKKVVEENIDMVYRLFPRLKERSRQLAGTLSGGEQEMCAIGRGMMVNPRLLVLDEPSLGLAPVVVDQIFENLEFLRKEKNLTVLLIEQNAQLALEASDRAYVIENGKVLFTGQSADLIRSEDIQKAYLGM